MRRGARTISDPMEVSSEVSLISSSANVSAYLSSDRRERSCATDSAIGAAAWVGRASQAREAFCKKSAPLQPGAERERLPSACGQRKQKPKPFITTRQASTCHHVSRPPGHHTHCIQCT